MSTPEGCIESCRGCPHRETSPEASLQQKTDWLRKKLSPWSELFLPIVSLVPESQLAYRDKVCLAAQWNGEHWNFGMKRKDEIIPIPDCPVHSKRINATQKVLQRFLPGPEIFPLVYYAQSGRQVVLVVKAKTLMDFIWEQKLFEELSMAGNEGLWLHLHPSAGRKIFAKTHWQLVWGNQYSKTDEGLSYGPVSFQQLIPELYQQAIKNILEFFSIQSGDSVIDLYSGIGGTLKAWTDNGAETIGVELNGEAVDCAQKNVPGAEVLRGKCNDRLPQLNEWLAGKNKDRLYLFTNPPRTGMEPEVVNWITEIATPLRIAYLSCSAGTLRRDLDQLVSGGYKVKNMIPFDFFPLTQHVECLVLLERQRSK